MLQLLSAQCICFLSARRHHCLTLWQTAVFNLNTTEQIQLQLPVPSRYKQICSLFTRVR